MAESLAERLPVIVPKVQVFYSPDIEGGIVWLKKLLSELVKAQYGIVCVTKDNLASSWLHFEAGALWNRAGKEVPVCPILLDLNPKQIKKSPLAFFQTRQFDEEAMRDLCLDIADKAGFDTEQARRNFSAVWLQLVGEVRAGIRAQRGSK
jgi:hypothetical protein